MLWESSPLPCFHYSHLVCFLLVPFFSLPPFFIPLAEPFCGWEAGRVFPSLGGTLLFMGVAVDWALKGGQELMIRVPNCERSGRESLQTQIC